MSADWQTRLAIEPGKRCGHTCVRGTRMAVYDVLSYLAAGMTVEQLLVEFPYLSKEDVQACLAYAADRERHVFIAAS